jgi:transcriptional regulator with PAS, ATPase and Fis domain
LEKKKITPTALSMLTNYEWKGNVRELQNTIEYLCCVSSQDTITTTDVQSKIFISVHESNFEVNDQNEKLDIIPIKYLEKMEIEKALKKFGNTTSGKLQAAKALNIGKSTLYRKLIEYDIEN